MIADRWGVTGAKVAAPYPCDKYVKAPTMQAWRGITIHAGVERVWSWLIQVRLAPYSYDLIDNMGRRSPRTLHDLEDPSPGDPFSAVGGRPVGRIKSVTHGEELTALIMNGHLSYVLMLVDERTTRLVMKVVAKPPRASAPLACMGNRIMAAKQLRTFKHLAESG